MAFDEGGNPSLGPKLLDGVQAAMGLVAVIVGLTNGVGGVVAGIWLAFRHEWRMLLLSFIWIVSSPMLIGVVLLLSSPLMILAAKARSNRSLAVLVCGFLVQVYTNLVMLACCAGALLFCLSHYKGTSKLTLVPYLLWSVGLALGPWQYLQSKEPNNEFSTLTLFSATVLYTAFAGSLLIGPRISGVLLLLSVPIQLIALPLAITVYVSRADARRAIAGE